MSQYGQPQHHQQQQASVVQSYIAVPGGQQSARQQETLYAPWKTSTSTPLHQTASASSASTASSTSSAPSPAYGYYYVQQSPLQQQAYYGGYQQVAQVAQPLTVSATGGYYYQQQVPQQLPQYQTWPTQQQVQSAPPLSSYHQQQQPAPFQQVQQQGQQQLQLQGQDVQVHSQMKAAPHQQLPQMQVVQLAQSSLQTAPTLKADPKSSQQVQAPQVKAPPPHQSTSKAVDVKSKTRPASPNRKIGARGKDVGYFRDVRDVRDTDQDRSRASASRPSPLRRRSRSRSPVRQRRRSRSRSRSRSPARSRDRTERSDKTSHDYSYPVPLHRGKDAVEVAAAAAARREKEKSHQSSSSPSRSSSPDISSQKPSESKRERTSLPIATSSQGASWSEFVEKLKTSLPSSFRCVVFNGSQEIVVDFNAPSSTSASNAVAAITSAGTTVSSTSTAGAFAESKTEKTTSVAPAAAAVPILPDALPEPVAAGTQAARSYDVGQGRGDTASKMDLDLSVDFDNDAPSTTFATAVGAAAAASSSARATAAVGMDFSPSLPPLVSPSTLLPSFQLSAFNLDQAAAVPNAAAAMGTESTGAASALSETPAQMKWTLAEANELRALMQTCLLKNGELDYNLILSKWPSLAFGRTPTRQQLYTRVGYIRRRSGQQVRQVKRRAKKQSATHSPVAASGSTGAAAAAAQDASDGELTDLEEVDADAEPLPSIPASPASLAVAAGAAGASSMSFGEIGNDKSSHNGFDWLLVATQQKQPRVDQPLSGPAAAHVSPARSPLTAASGLAIVRAERKVSGGESKRSEVALLKKQIETARSLKQVKPTPPRKSPETAYLYQHLNQSLMSPLASPTVVAAVGLGGGSGAGAGSGSGSGAGVGAAAAVSSKPRDIVVPVGASSSASLSEEALLISGSGRVVKQRRLTNLSAASVKGKTLSAASALPDTNILYASLKKHQKALSTFLQRPSITFNCGEPMRFASAKSAMRAEFDTHMKVALKERPLMRPLEEVEKKVVYGEQETYLNLLHIDLRLKKQRALREPRYYLLHSQWMHDVQVIVEAIASFWQKKIASGSLERTIVSPVAVDLKTATAKRYVQVVEHFDDSLAVADNTSELNAIQVVADCGKFLKEFMESMDYLSESDLDLW